MKQEWKDFIEKLSYEVAFWYKNDFKEEYSYRFDFPCVLLAKNNNLQLLLSAVDLENISIEKLKQVLLKRITCSR